MWLGGQRHALTDLPLAMNGRSLCTKLDGQRRRSGRVRKIFPTQGFDPRTVQPVASRYTHCAIPARFYPVLYITDTFPSPSYYRNNTNQIQSSWRRRQRVPSKHQKKLFIKSNVRTRRDLDFCCTFGCSRFKSQHRNPLSWFRFIRSCRLNLQERTWIHTNYSMTPSWHTGTQKAHIKINVVPVPCNVLITMDLIRLIVHIHAYKFVLS